MGILIELNRVTEPPALGHASKMDLSEFKQRMYAIFPSWRPDPKRLGTIQFVDGVYVTDDPALQALMDQAPI